jgi:hypothetical protein
MTWLRVAKVPIDFIVRDALADTAPRTSVGSASINSKAFQARQIRRNVFEPIAAHATEGVGLFALKTNRINVTVILLAAVRMALKSCAAQIVILAAALD